ncbi:MAG: DeoR family transcriptional regulator [Candidatus Falkowbacteria bacterium]
MISERKKIILQTIIKEYLKNAQPVSSGMLVEKCKLGVSPATVRNDMVELEEEGYIIQPHTSAGRVPTELAYELELEELKLNREKKNLKELETKLLDNLFSYEELAFKQTAKAIAELANCAVFWAFHKNDLYYTGLSNLFAQPEFKQTEIVYDVSVVIDHMEDIIDELFEDLEYGQQIMVGSKNPFGNFLSTVLVKYKKDNQSGVFGLMGPTRMDYAHNLALVNYIKSKFE